MTRTCLGFAITTFLTCGAITAATDAAFPVASTTTTSSFESFFAKASRRGRRMSTRPSRLSLPSSQATASAKARWISRPMIRMVAPPSLFVQGGSWRATRHLLIRAHGASGKGARGGHVTSSGSQPTVYRPPARTFVLPAPRVQDGLTISPSPSREQADSKAPTDHIPDNGIVERFHKTVLDEFYRVAFRKKIYGSIAELQSDLDYWVRSYNEERAHQGRWCFGKTPMQTFLDATPLAKEKMIAAGKHPKGGPDTSPDADRQIKWHLLHLGAIDRDAPNPH